LADTYPNPSNATFRTAIGAFYDYVKGLLGATGNAADARTALGIGPVISFRNLLINGNFAINQRGYASGAATTGANQYTLDRWRVVTSGQNASFGAGNPDRTVTAPAGGIEQVIEGANIAGGVYTLSWTGSATATVNGAAITNGGNTASLTANADVTVRFSGGTVGQAQFELGTVATPFERRHSGLELTLCQRYYEIGDGRLEAYSLTGNNSSYKILFKVTKRVAPTLGYTTVTSNNCSAAFVGAPTIQGFTWVATIAASGSFTFDGTWRADAEIP
jgi:hypothetical protein